jgi:NAD(P)-dependent dehydrogenase (short-subunit alcohol dehydrogenase family)
MPDDRRRRRVDVPASPQLARRRHRPVLTDAPVRFDGQVAVVTGAGRGLGAAYARLIAARGAATVVHDAGVDLEGRGFDPGPADSVVEEIVRAGGVAVPSYEDLAAEGGPERLVRQATERLGRLDVLVSNAGLLARAAIEDVSDDLLDRMVKVGVVAPYVLCRTAMPIMKRQGYGRIVLTTSGRAMYVNAALTGLTAYAVGRAAQLGLMVGLAAEGQPHDVRTNAISPVALTRMTLTPPEGQMTADQVAPAVAFLASSRCDFSGTIVRAAGGRFSAVRWAFTEGVDLGPDPIAPEVVAERWAEIAGPQE